MLEEFPKCPKCKSVMLPLSDYGDGASVLYKAWACLKQECGYGIRIDKGVVTYMQVMTKKRNG